MKALLDRVLKNDLCSGCGMCSSVASDDALRMRLNADGYHRPALNPAVSGQGNRRCANTGAFAKSCPA